MTYSAEDEAQMLDRACRGDSTALGALVEPWRGPLFAYIDGMVTLRQDAEDLLQDVLVRVLESLPQFRGEARFKTWLFGIATHVCLDHLRQKKRWVLQRRKRPGSLGISEPVFRHRLAAARSTMIQSYERLCQLINQTGLCYQCRGIEEFAPEGHRGRELVQIEVAPGVAVSPETLFDARLEIVREAELANGSSRLLHDDFFTSLTAREEAREPGGP